LPRLHNLQKELYNLLADKIERDPSLLRIPLENIERWLAEDRPAPHRLKQWRELIWEAQSSGEGMAKFLALLRDQSEPVLHLKSFNVFPRVLGTKERRAVILKCAFSH
jgi:hypothetical protein